MKLRFGFLWAFLACGLVVAAMSASSADDPQQEADSNAASEAAEEDAKADEKESSNKEQPKEGEKKEEEGKKTAAEKKRETLKIEPKKFELEIEVDGVFVAKKTTEVELRPEEWSQFEITEIVPHGSEIKEGEMLVKFDAEDLNEAIDDLERDQRMSELTLRKTEEELPRTERMLELALEDAQKSYDRAMEDQKHYEEVERDLDIKSTERSLKNAQQYLDYEKEELQQLEKMYAADDLTEETEEIILKRQRSAVESAEFYLEQAKVYHDRALSVNLPRRDVDRKERLEQAKMALERAKLAMQVDAPKARYDLEKMRKDRLDSLEKHANLTKDKSLMTLTSPAEGLVYYGRCVEGEWSEMASMISKLQPKNSAPTKTVLFTIVSPRPMHVLAKIDEKNRPDVSEGLKVEVKPTGGSDLEMEGTVAKVSNVPVGNGKFSLKIELEEAELPEWLVPGMSGKSTITTYAKEDAIVVPKKAVHDEEEDDDKKYVWVVDEKDKKKPAEKRSVKLGKSKGDDVEIVEGLKAGEVISLEDEGKEESEEKKEEGKEEEKKEE